MISTVGLWLTVDVLYCMCDVQVLAHFIDCVFESSEKDKVTCLLKAVLLNVWPHLHNHRYCPRQQAACP